MVVVQQRSSCLTSKAKASTSIAIIRKDYKKEKRGINTRFGSDPSASFTTIREEAITACLFISLLRQIPSQCTWSVWTVTPQSPLPARSRSHTQRRRLARRRRLRGIRCVHGDTVSPQDRRAQRRRALLLRRKGYVFRFVSLLHRFIVTGGNENWTELSVGGGINRPDSRWSRHYCPNLPTFLENCDSPKALKTPQFSIDLDKP